MPDLHYMGLDERKVVIFVDILGFSQLVLNNEKTTRDSKGGIIIDVPSIYKIISTIDYEKRYQEHKKIKFLWVSDSIVITTDPENINAALSELRNVINQFYCCSFALRGAITVGALHHEENIWGPAFVHAVVGEKKAKYPRIIIRKDDVLSLLKDSSQVEFFKETEDPEFLFYDFFDDYISNAIKTQQNISAALNVYSQFVFENIETQTGSVLEKYIWLGKQLQHNLIKHKAYIEKMTFDEPMELVHKMMEMTFE